MGFPRSTGCSAFTLIEVVLALGLVTFGLVAIMGLLPVALNTGQEASVDTAFAAMDEVVSSTLRARTFVQDQTSAAAFFAFDKDGRLLTNTDAPLELSSAYFTCTATSVVQGATTNALYYRLQFLWPWPGVNVNPSTNLSTISVVNYD